MKKCGIFHLHYVFAQKVSDFGAFWILNFQIRDVQPVSVCAFLNVLTPTYPLCNFTWLSNPALFNLFSLVQEMPHFNSKDTIPSPHHFPLISGHLDQPSHLHLPQQTSRQKQEKGGQNFYTTLPSW
jgi:hypothetical protein